MIKSLRQVLNSFREVILVEVIVPRSHIITFVTYYFVIYATKISKNMIFACKGNDFKNYIT